MSKTKRDSDSLACNTFDQNKKDTKLMLFLSKRGPEIIATAIFSNLYIHNNPKQSLTNDLVENLCIVV